MRNLPEILKKIEKLAAVCRAEIEASDRPLDAFPVQWVLPLFFVHPDHAPSWRQKVEPEVWERIDRLKQEPEPLVIPETELQRTPFALSHAETRKFRDGPLLRMLSLVDLQLVRSRGGRLKRGVEIAIREALEFEVFRRDPEIGALLSCMRARFDRIDVAVLKGAGLNRLAELAWAEGIPTKGHPADKTFGESDQRLALFEALRSEDEKLAVGWLAGLTEPSEAEASIVAQVRYLAHAPWSRAEFEDAIKTAANRVHTLMRACAHVTEVAREKHQLANRATKVERLQRPPKGDNPFHREPMTAKQHAVFGRNEFSALELAFVAVAADVDPNLLTANHVLATPEFRLARKIGRIGRGHQASFDLDEVKDLKELILKGRGNAERVMYFEVHRYLADCALELMPATAWPHRLNDAISEGRELIVPE